MQIPRFILSYVIRRFLQKRWSACSWLRVNASTTFFSLFVMLRSEFFLHQALTLITKVLCFFVELYQNFIFLNIEAKIFYRSLNRFLQFIFCQTMGIRSYKSGGETSDLIYRLCSHFSGYLLRMRWHENHTDPYQTELLFTHKMILARFL